MFSASNFISNDQTEKQSKLNSIEAKQAKSKWKWKSKSELASRANYKQLANVHLCNKIGSTGRSESRF